MNPSIKKFETTDFTIEDMGVQEIDVYDIEVQDNHNFFGNNICVHNSVYLNMEAIVEKYQEKTGETDTNKIINYMDRVCNERIEVFIERIYSKMAIETNAYEPRMVMKREVLASRGIWKAKKNYALYVYDSEGVRFAEPKLKIIGIETQRSSTPEWCRGHLKHTIKLLMTGSENDIQDYVANIKEEYMKLPTSDIAFPRGLNEMDKWVLNERLIKGTPINVRAAFIHNMLLEECDMKNKYREITTGNKLKFVYLREPNPSKQNVIAFYNSLPKEFGLNDYVDYDMMFQKSFLKPLQNLLDVIGWDSQKRNTLEHLIEWN